MSHAPTGAPLPLPLVMVMAPWLLPLLLAGSMSVLWREAPPSPSEGLKLRSEGGRMSASEASKSHRDSVLRCVGPSAYCGGGAGVHGC